MPKHNPYKRPKSNKKKRTREKTAVKPRKYGKERTLRKFEELPIGYHLKLRAPLEYELIMEVSGSKMLPDADLIEAICYGSINPFFKTILFRKALIEYRKYGNYTTRPKDPSSVSAQRSAMRMRKSVAIKEGKKRCE